jgi:hypothetical protein
MHQLLKADKMPFKLSEIKLEGRTKRSIEGRWAHLRKRAIEYDNADVAVEPPKPKGKKAAKRKFVGDGMKGLSG